MTEYIKFKYDIHYTGSKGNCVSIYYDNIAFMIDFGKPYKYIEPFLYDKQFIFISHKHGDHLVYTTYKKIRENFPHIKILSNQTVNEELVKRKLPQVDVIFEDDLEFQIGDLRFASIQNYHGAGEEYTETHGFIIQSPFQNLLYATDLSTTTDYQAYLDKHDLKIDVMLLEGNYDENVIAFYEETRVHTGYSIFANGSYRHLAISEYHNFCKVYANDGAELEMLHTSTTYGDFAGLMRTLNRNNASKLTWEDIDAWRKKNA